MIPYILLKQPWFVTAWLSLCHISHILQHLFAGIEITLHNFH